jgi:chaperonin GroES
MSYEQLEILGPRVLARVLPVLDITEGGLVRPDVTRVPQNRAVVEKIGPGTLTDAGQLIPMPFAVGDVVFYQKFAGFWLELAGKERLMLMAEEIQARLPASVVTIVTHTGENEHLEGEPCLICMKPEQDAARERLAQMRAELVASPAPPLEALTPDALLPQ